MPFNPLLGPDQCYGVDDGGPCEVCGLSIDGDCDCQLCDDCRRNLEDGCEWEELEVPHLQTGRRVKLTLCLDCYEKRQPDEPVDP